MESLGVKSLGVISMEGRSTYRHIVLRANTAYRFLSASLLLAALCRSTLA